ncbi:hypothetical protein ACO0LC_28405 [Undibacterium sp. JH2W]|uniref:hypothetical protein n=1 Tax=Undibacterium sp. JH2W TaxID=3413037 RepID=UPI003BF30B28
MDHKVNVSESKVSSTPTEFASSSGYDSGWIAATNTTSSNLVVTHNLGNAPTSVRIMFSPDQETVYPVLWSWDPNNSGNPVSIWANRNTINLSIYSGTPLHGTWNGNTSQWTHWNTGYFRIFAS